jgi:PAS domain S-box-containing protein
MDEKNKEQEEKMGIVHRQLIEIVEATSDFIGFADAKDKHIIYISKAGRKMCGIGENDDVTKLKIMDVHPEWVNKMLAEKMLPTAMRDGAWKGESAFLSIKDKLEIPVSMILSSHKDARGNIIIFSTISRDITEQKKAKDLLVESETKYKAIFNGAVEGIIAADLETRQFRYANSSICRMFGYTEEEFSRLGVADIHPKESLDYVLGEFKAQAQGEKILSTGLPCLRKDGILFYANVNASPIVLEGRRCVLGFFTDVTEYRKMEKDLQKKMEMLESFNKIATGRELRMIELKKEINALSQRLGEKTKYDSV